MTLWGKNAFAGLFFFFLYPSTTIQHILILILPVTAVSTSKYIAVRYRRHLRKNKMMFMKNGRKSKCHSKQMHIYFSLLQVFNVLIWREFIHLLSNKYWTLLTLIFRKLNCVLCFVNRYRFTYLVSLLLM